MPAEGMDMPGRGRMRLRLVPALTMAVLLCLAPGPSRAEGTAAADPVYACTQDSDCVVKDVHNCCGYYPACVNTNAVIDIKAVERRCAKENVAGVCGFPVISGCACQGGACVNIQASSDRPQ